MEEVPNLIRVLLFAGIGAPSFELRVVQDLPRVFAEVLRGRVKLCVFLFLFVISHRLSLFTTRSVNQSQQRRTEQLPSKANSHISALFQMASKTFWPACDGM